MPAKSDRAAGCEDAPVEVVADPPDPPQPASRTSRSRMTIRRTHVAFPGRDHFSTFTARAATIRTVVIEMVDSIAITSLAGRVSGITSVGLKAVAFVRATYA